MQIILLSGGSGSRLWPLSNDTRSKQFLKILPVEGTDERESMIQRVVRQIKDAHLDANITIATSISQRDSVTTQLGNQVNIVTEPNRRHTFPAICLACEYLANMSGCSDEETVVVMPCDPLTEAGYYDAIKNMADGISKDLYQLILMGIKPTYPSSKYGYILPGKSTENEPNPVKVVSFKEKPSVAEAEKLIEDEAFWNAGVFAFKLGFIRSLSKEYIALPENLEEASGSKKFEYYLQNFDKYPRISFDYEVVEKTADMGMVPFKGFWKDLGTWNTLTDELSVSQYGNVITDGTTQNTHIFNELNIPLLCIGTSDLIIAASPDGIIVSEKSKSENVKKFAATLKQRPMFEERRWGTYKVVDYVEFPDNFHALTKQLTLNPGACISYQKHSCRDEVWTFIDGEGEIVLDGERKPVRRGDVINIPKGQKHALRATTSLTFIEVQHGSNLIEEDIERFPYSWED